jgi:glutamate-ammonia-ligase adenylyltransferase
VRSLASYEAYYERWSRLWEAQALLRAEPIAGDADLGRRFIDLIDPIRYPAAGLSDLDLRELRRIKARVETERMPRGIDPHTHLKLGPGGLADVEWTAQWLQLAHAATVPGLRTTRTADALRAAVDAGLLEVTDAETLVTAWRTAMRVRNATTLVRGRASDTLPSPGRDLAGTALLVGYPHTHAGELSEEVRRAARHARSVVERMLYG